MSEQDESPLATTALTATAKFQSFLADVDA
jgi:hypothetical protein